LTFRGRGRAGVRWETAMPEPGYFHLERAEVLPFIPEHYQKVLDVGCGEGLFTEQLDKASERWGIEPDRDAAEIAAKKMDKVLTGRFEEVYPDLPEYYFDLVICNDVIEHMEDHDRFFETIKTKMAENATLVASLPNVRYAKNLWNLLFKKDWKYGEAGILDRTHLRFFTKKSMLRALREHGFEILRVGGLHKVNPRLSLALTILGLGTLNDTLYLQYVCVAKKSPSPRSFPGKDKS
jgi:2-polyprenyl-3-methyl-5-hydroxy-6-metoxy-1,4-benzoquinol methylase